MPMCIDRFSIVSGVAIVVGWSSDYQPGAQLRILQSGRPVVTITVGVRRPDVAEHYGLDAADWGFRAYGVLEGTGGEASSIGLSFSENSAIERLTDHRGHDPAYVLFENFIAEVNSRGGRILEIGARARSGNSCRERFGHNVQYIGVDIAAGENVDVVCDAHHLSDALREPVDFVFSVSTFEHFLMPWKVVLEINKVLRIGGKVYSHSHQTWPVHDEPWDFFRFSRESWAGLYSRHTGFRICDARRGEKVVITSLFNRGGAFDGLDHGLGYAMTVCLAEKISEPLVAWEARTEEIQKIEYTY